MSEYGTKLRLIRMLIAILENPFGYTKKRLSEIYDCSEDTIKNDFTVFKNAGLFLEKDSRHRYQFKVEKSIKQLKDLLHFSEEDQIMLYQAIDSLDLNNNKQERLKKKLSSLYDFKRLGHAYLRKPYLTKVDMLLEANEHKKIAILKDYRSSNTNEITDRKVEPFHISPSEDTVQAYDVEKKGLRHFRISRIKKVVLIKENWEYEGHHNIMRTDPFRIVDNNQVPVHLRLKIGAYNELVERFPLTKSYLEETEEDEVFDFQCNVNHRFLGLTNFILGYHHQLVEVLEPESLLEHLREQIKNMNF